MCFGKTVAFDFDEKLTQSVAQITMQYHVSKDFLHLHFAVGQGLSISGHDLENGRMSCKAVMAYGRKNSDVDFVPLLFTLLTFSCFCCSCKPF